MHAGGQRPRSKHSLLTSFTTTLAGSRAGARCDAARGCCGGGGRRRTRRGPGVSTVYLLPLLPLSLAPELARAATRREAAALAEGVGGACTARRVVLPLLYEGRHAQRPSGARRTEATSTRRTSTAPSRRPRGSTPSTRHSRRPRHCSGRRRPASAAAQRVYPCYDGVAAAEGPSRPLLPIERDLGRGSPSFRDGGLSQRRRRLPSWRALRRGARLLRQRRAAAHAPRPQSKHSLLTSFTTTLAGSRAGARCDAARGCCGGRGRRRTRRGPGVSTVYLLLSLPIVGCVGLVEQALLLTLTKRKHAR